jgi:hypothetical protein
MIASVVRDINWKERSLCPWFISTKIMFKTTFSKKKWRSHKFALHIAATTDMMDPFRGLQMSQIHLYNHENNFSGDYQLNLTN